MQGDTDKNRRRRRTSGLLFRGADVDELHDLVSQRFAPHRMVVRGGQNMDGRFRCLHAGELGLYELGYGAEVDVVPGELPEFYNIHIPLSGGGSIITDGVTQPSPLCLVGPGQRVAMRWDGKCVNHVLNIPRAVVDRSLALRLGDAPLAPLRFASVLDPRAGPVASWLRLEREFAAFAGSELAELSPQGLRNWERLLVETLLDAQPHPLSDKVVGRGATALPPAVRRATTYCAEHAHEVIGVSELALAARVSIRSLREGFRTHLRTTPMRYLCLVRLDLARRDLQAIAAGNATGSVLEVQLRWCFPHSSRFAKCYREVYGELPSETLRGGAEGPPDSRKRRRTRR
ncbi:MULTISPECIES: AraC family transcriptional regulator [unclassified Streptomyces]|uniref:AraC family transcriptional regulator n=1 Tax=Streptomyces TaxID=1883 RepID=UPI001368465C|nr:MULTISPECIES: AraC family transcriptional regulator [unclassified Streptomyces]NEA06119.1 AraC family transcriptional regulator [Streptomyces sp. SID10116]MYY80106.1 helix-turn-helix domain-containing protein [Streptomyces sp. SID335]MYZ18181.1 helix-turn-helix domain-containing protein [Streptomyces sp. SID337]NDZ85322.1 AraC family transcriptional regulator [Streptomyces sp. SID10115]NEB46568.1 AraC family transcriptional regulator [Streptomyces sp. SID339]